MTNLEKYYKTHGVGDGWFIKLDSSIMGNKEFMKISNHEDFVKFMLSEAKYEPTELEITNAIIDYNNCIDGAICSNCSHCEHGTYQYCDGKLDEDINKILEWALEKVKEDG